MRLRTRVYLLISNAVTRAFKKHHGMALDLVYRAENRCKSSGGAGLARATAQNRGFPVLPPPRPKNLKTPLTALELSSLKSSLQATASSLEPGSARTWCRDVTFEVVYGVDSVQPTLQDETPSI